MTNKALLLAAACLVSTAACAQMKEKLGQGHQEPVSADRCTESPCRMEITVDDSGGDCKVKIKPEVLLVHKVPEATIQWKLAAPGYKLVSITFKDETKEWFAEYGKRVKVPSRDQFHGKQVHDQDAQVMDKNSEDGSWL